MEGEVRHVSWHRSLQRFELGTATGGRGRCGGLSRSQRNAPRKPATKFAHLLDVS
jgi:hypothetical protein